MDTGTRLAVAAVFVWMGTVLAMSFLEVPLRFRVEGVRPRIGLGGGRLVSRALNAFEYVFVIVIAVALFTTRRHSASTSRCSPRSLRC